MPGAMNEEPNIPDVDGSGAAPHVPRVHIPWSEFVVGLAALNLLYGTILLGFFCFVPMLLFLVGAFFEHSIFSAYSLFELVLMIGVSVAFNCIVVGLWCVRRLFQSRNRRIVGLVTAAMIYIFFIVKFSVAYFGAILTLVALAVTVWGKQKRRAVG